MSRVPYDELVCGDLVVLKNKIFEVTGFEWVNFDKGNGGLWEELTVNLESTDGEPIPAMLYNLFGPDCPTLKIRLFESAENRKRKPHGYRG